LKAEIVQLINADDNYDNAIFLNYYIKYKYMYSVLSVKIIYVEDKNTVEYSYGFYIDYLKCEEHLEYNSIPQVIRLDKSVKDEKSLVRMMYSQKEYMEYLVKNKINLERIKSNAIDIITETANLMLENKCLTRDEFDKHFGLNPLDLTIDIDGFYTNNTCKLLIHKEYKNNAIRVKLEVSFSNNRELVEYSYNVYNSHIDNNNIYRHFDDKHSIKLSPIECWEDDMDIMFKLIKSYHIVDQVFKEEMNMIDNLDNN
jgi:hypothetical protein